MQFGRFRLVPHRRELLADGMSVPIGSRALDVLIALIEARGELVTKDELSNRVWPGTILKESTLRFQISTIRKVLGDGRDSIKTISGRGYCFAADIATAADLEENSSGSHRPPRHIPMRRLRTTFPPSHPASSAARFS
jgi:DNA-binding winged helix-turn-helix (wHTH) protein